MNSTNNKLTPELLGKYLAGEASPEEAIQIDEWLADPENRKEYEETLHVWNLLPGNQEPENLPSPLHGRKSSRAFIRKDWADQGKYYTTGLRWLLFS